MQLFNVYIKCICQYLCFHWYLYLKRFSISHNIDLHYCLLILTIFFGFLGFLWHFFVLALRFYFRCLAFAFAFCFSPFNAEFWILFCHCRLFRHIHTRHCTHTHTNTQELTHVRAALKMVIKYCCFCRCGLIIFHTRLLIKNIWVLDRLHSFCIVRCRFSY